MGNVEESRPLELLTSAEVAERFGVCRETVTGWAGKKMLSAIRTPGGRYRFDAAEVARLERAQASDACG